MFHDKRIPRKDFIKEKAILVYIWFTYYFTECVANITITQGPRDRWKFIF